MSEFLTLLGLGMVAGGVLLALFPDSEGGIANFDMAIGRSSVPSTPSTGPTAWPRRPLLGLVLVALALPAFAIGLGIVALLILIVGAFLLAVPRGTEDGNIEDARRGLTPITTGRRIALGLVLLGATIAASGCLTAS